MAITRTQIAKQLLANGGRTGFQGGGADMGKERGSVTGREPGPVGGGKGVRGDRDPMAQFTPQAAATAKEMRDATMGAGDRFVPALFPTIKAFANRFQVSKPTPFDIQRRGFIKALGPQAVDMSGMDRGGDVPLWAQLGFSSEAEYLAALARAQAPSTTDQETEEEKETFTPSFRVLAGGGMAERAPYEGGIMDLESARQMYGLGKLVKKVTRSVKKIAKSPIGKAAILGAVGFGIPGTGFKGLMGTQKGLGIRKFLTDSIFGKVTDLGIAGPNRAVRTGGLLNFIRDNPFLTIGGVSALAGLTTKTDEDDDQEQQYAGADLPFPVDYYLSGQYAPNMRLAAEGGLMRAGYQEGSKEPVAKKTMPLLDMGGMEKDYREEGGFVPIGRMEKADDVPARLSKNEFVFTADAVRNAGDGDVDLGAEKMYNMMKNLEAGGDVSEESQGMDGARKMFQTSQRLEEVI